MKKDFDISYKGIVNQNHSEILGQYTLSRVIEKMRTCALLTVSIN